MSIHKCTVVSSSWQMDILGPITFDLVPWLLTCWVEQVHRWKKLTPGLLSPSQNVVMHAHIFSYLPKYERYLLCYMYLSFRFICWGQLKSLFLEEMYVLISPLAVAREFFELNLLGALRGILCNDLTSRHMEITVCGVWRLRMKTTSSFC